MKSIKPGRGPSKMNAVGGIIAAVFGVFWCVLACSIGCYFMIPFGLLFIGFAIYIAVYNGHNASSKDRYSIIDIVDDEEESDPHNEKYERGEEKNLYCPYCGRKIDSDYEFCPKCGKKLPE